MLETLEGDTVATVVIAFLVAGIFKGALGMGLRRYPLQLWVWHLASARRSQSS